jgi:hypothetical protein
MEAAWLEGARHNGVRGGAGERDSSIARLRPAFDGKVEKEVVLGAVSSLKRLLSETPSGYDASRGFAFYREVAESALVLSAAIRLWLACLPHDHEPLPGPPFQLPFSLLGTLAIHVVTHPLLSEPSQHSFSFSAFPASLGFVYHKLRVAFASPPRYNAWSLARPTRYHHYAIPSG